MGHTVEELVELGIYKPVQVDSAGQTEYSCDLKLARELAPDVFIAETLALDEALLAAVDAGYLEMDFEIREDGTLKVGYTTTEKL